MVWDLDSSEWVVPNAKVRVGACANGVGQQDGATAVGINAGNSYQGIASAAFGVSAGQMEQEDYACAFGPYSGRYFQGAYSLAAGAYAGEGVYDGDDVQSYQKNFSVLLGSYAGSLGCEEYSVYIGGLPAATNYIPKYKTLVLNASGVDIDTPAEESLVVKPVATLNSRAGFYAMYYNPTTGEVAADYAPSNPSVVASNYSYSPTTLRVTATITGSGNAPLTTYGLIWNVGPSPGLNDPTFSVYDGSTSSAYTTRVSQLSATDPEWIGQYVRIRVYATNAASRTGYSNSYEFRANPICIVSGTPVPVWNPHACAWSFKRIQDVTYDDELASWDFWEGKVIRTKPAWISVPILSGNFKRSVLSNGTVLKTAGEFGHRMYDASKGSFEYIHVGMRLLLQDKGRVSVVTHETVEEPCMVYNIVAGGGHINFFVGETPVLSSCRWNNFEGATICADTLKFVQFPRVDARALAGKFVDFAHATGIAQDDYEGMEYAKTREELRLPCLPKGQIYTLFLDHQGVMCTDSCKERTFHPACVRTLNALMACFGGKLQIITSSDWQLDKCADMAALYASQGVENVDMCFAGVTNTAHFVGNSMCKQEVETWRANSINKCVADRCITGPWVAVDDLDLSNYLPQHNFVQVTNTKVGLASTAVVIAILRAFAFML